MIYSLPPLDKEAIPLTHFPTRHQAFIFRACEYVPLARIAKILCTDVETVKAAAAEMGLPCEDPGDLWLQRGYITIIRRMWHLLPYEQLLELLETDEESLAVLMKEDDFLNVKLRAKPRCERVVWCPLNAEEKRRTAEIKKVIEALDFSGKKPFAFEYSVPHLTFAGKERFSTRMIYAFSGLYQRAFDIDSEEYLPDDQLSAYQRLGINGIWTQGVLSQLTPFPFEPALSVGYEERIERMRKLTERLNKFGIKLFLYINEPRYMPFSFFEKHPHLRGHVRGTQGASLCTSTEEVQNYLKDAIEAICKAVPLLGGFFTITRSENLTNCYSHSGTSTAPCTCPRCKDRSVGEVIGEVIGCILEGARRVSREIKVFAWSWAWKEMSEDIIRHLPKEVILMSQSELDIPFEFGGVRGNVVDYSMSIIGPGDYARNEWRIARECGLSLGAKVQINTTWEASTVPAIPVSPSIEQHMQGLLDEKVEHLLLSWTLGGYPGRNIAAAAKYFYEKCTAEDKNPARRAAEEQFVKAFREFPFHVGTLYFGPQNAGPSTLLFEEPTGYTATMTCFAYDDLKKWSSIYPIDVLESQFEKLCTAWEIGLKMIPESDSDEGAVMARATYALFRSSLNQIRFIRYRDSGRYREAIEMARSERKRAELMLTLMNQNAAIGYEAANHYYFSKFQLAEKILNCDHIIETYRHRTNHPPLTN